MKRKFLRRKSIAFICVIVLIITSFTSMPVFAEENNLNVASVSVEPRKTSYYPITGLSSGYYTGLKSDSATFNLPKGNLTITYNYDAQNHSATLYFVKGSTQVTAHLNGTGLNYTTSVTIPSSGTYEVYLVSAAGGYNIEKYYGYNLYTP